MYNSNLISIIILNWNGKHHLDECLNSVLQQTYTNYEIILVDNGSTDGSQEFVRTNFPSVNLICLDRNYGFCGGNNRGFEAARGEYIVLLNNDTVVEPDWLEKLYECVTSDPEVGFCASKIVSYCDKSLLDAAGDGYSICGAGFKRGYLENRDKYNETGYVFGACAGAAIYKKEMLDRIGFLDEDFFVAYEDADLSFRAQLAGYKCRYAADAVVYHKINSTLGKLSDFYVFYGHRNVEYGYFKNMPGGLMAKTIFRHFLFNLIGMVYFTIRGKGWTFLKAKFDFIRNLGIVLEKRKKVQLLKRVDDKYLWSIMEKKWLRTRLKGK